MALDAVPWGVMPSDRPKEMLGEFTNRAGIWQGQWMMFAPNPSVNNYWLTADVYNSDGTPQMWSSPYWANAGTVEKFRRFRFLNYYNRLQLPQHQHAAEDFTQFLSHSALGEPGLLNEYLEGGLVLPERWGEAEPHRVVLYANGLRMHSPEDDSMPLKDDITWITFSESIARTQ